MQVSASTEIFASAKEVWAVIADIEHCVDTISGIDSVEILQPATGPSITGLTWRETRTMFGKSATEEMCISEAKEPHYYDTRAVSHGSVYLTHLAIEETESGCTLTMTFNGEPQTFGAKFVWALTGWMAKRFMQKTIAQDLADIKAAVEA